MAGFEVTFNGRFCVTPEGRSGHGGEPRPLMQSEIQKAFTKAYEVVDHQFSKVEEMMGVCP
jgi:hypothetical protein